IPRSLPDRGLLCRSAAAVHKEILCAPNVRYHHIRPLDSKATRGNSRVTAPSATEHRNPIAQAAEQGGFGGVRGQSATGLKQPSCRGPQVRGTDVYVAPGPLLPGTAP